MTERIFKKRQTQKCFEAVLEDPQVSKWDFRHEGEIPTIIIQLKEEYK